MTVRDILDTEQKQALIIKVLEAHVDKCERLANAPSRGYGSVKEQITREKWNNEADLTAQLLNDFIIEMN